MKVAQVSSTGVITGPLELLSRIQNCKAHHAAGCACWEREWYVPLGVLKTVLGKAVGDEPAKMVILGQAVSPMSGYAKKGP